MKNKNVLIGSVALIATGLFFLVKYMKNKPKSDATNNASIFGNPSEIAYSNNIINVVKEPLKLIPASFPLKKGSVGIEVQVLQKWLNSNGYSNPKLVEDGIFGAKTESTVIAMQNNPYSKEIVNYIANMTKNFKVIPKGTIDREFYDVFITKMKKMPIGVDLGIQFN